MSKYKNYPSDNLVARYKKKQRHLIIPNIIVMIMAVVVIIASFKLPMLEVTMHISGEGLLALTDMFTEDSTEEADSETELVTDVLKDIDLDYTLAIYPMDVIEAEANGGSAVSLIAGMLGDVAGVINKAVAQIVPNLSATMADAFYEIIAEEAAEAEISEETTQKLKDAFDALGENDTDGAIESFNDFADTLVNDYELDAESADLVKTDFAEIVDSSVDESGEFVYLTFLSNVLEYASDETADESYAELKETIDTLQNFDAETFLNELIGETIDQEMNDMIVLALFAVVMATVGLCAILWGIMFIFIFFHTISRNKRFTMWYVKMYAWIPCFIFFLLPTAIFTILPAVLTGEALAVITSITEAVSMSFGGSGIVSGLCYLILWIMSIFWFFPVKHGIRAMKKELKKRNIKA